MKISIGSNIIKGPWGGGNQFAKSLSEYLAKKGWEVISDLKEKNIDIILMTEPRITSRTSAYNQKHISKYLFKNPETIVVHRINECDERKDTKGVNKYLMRANRAADHTIFISNFLKNLFVEKKLFSRKKSCDVIRNGADPRIFNRKDLKKWDKENPIRLVTHHWGFNYNKGFDIYKMLGRIKSIDSVKIKFSYIGRVPDKEIYKANIISPLSGRKLAEEIKTNNIYVTGSINEPGGMHHIEGAMCGLPLLFRNSGALPEHCTGFGQMFEGVDDFQDRLKKLINKYDYYFKKMAEYPYNADFMCRGYEEVFLKLLSKASKIHRKNRRFYYLGLYLLETILQFSDLFTMKFKRLTEIFYNDK